MRYLVKRMDRLDNSFITQSFLDKIIIKQKNDGCSTEPSSITKW